MNYKPDMNFISHLSQSKLKVAVTFVVAILILVALVSLLWPANSNNKGAVDFEVSRGDTLNGVANRLEKQGFIKSKYPFIAYVILIGREDDLKAGRYAVSQSMSTLRIANNIVGGLSEPNDIGILIPEGYNVWEIDERLADFGLVERGQFSKKFLKEEGQLFPDTYRFSRDLLVFNLTPSEREAALQHIGDSMIKNFTKKVGFVDSKTLIIASLLEKETRKEEDMKLVSGIIQNRLKKGMLLQLDASVGYGWCIKRFVPSKPENCDVTEAPIASEIRSTSPFNIYKNPGLPPFPIANPGEQSINAARNPTPSDYFYYLSTRDGSQIIYSKTGAEHEANRRKYLGIY
jgi:UPF0755 protein